MSEELSSLDLLDLAELERRVAGVRERMRPLEQDLAALRVERDVLLTEIRRRERSAHRISRSDLKAAMKEGKLPTVADLVAGSDSGSFDDYGFNLKTGGAVGLGFPGGRWKSGASREGRKMARATAPAEAAELYAGGGERGSRGGPGVRVHFPGTRQERLVPADEVYARAGDREEK